MQIFVSTHPHEKLDKWESRHQALVRIIARAKTLFSVNNVVPNIAKISRALLDVTGIDPSVW